MRLIDIHTHIYPPAIAHKAAASIRQFYQLNTHEMDGTADTLLKKGDQVGIDRFVILPVAVRSDRTRHINEFILEQVAIQPRFIGFGTIHAAMENIADEAQFFTPAQIDELRELVDDENLPVLCFGLRTDFLTHFFPGAQRLMELADSLTEIKTVCACGKKATANSPSAWRTTITWPGTSTKSTASPKSSPAARNRIRGIRMSTICC